MIGLATVCIVLGLVIIVSRGPLVLAPDATLRVYRQLLATDARVRILGACIVALAVPMILVAQGSDLTTAKVVFVMGWGMACVGVLLLLLFPAAYRRFAESILDAMSQALRPVGAIAVGIGVLFIWMGVSVL
jgi:uncharacterized protein YjeT (DUF2065 family)